MAYNNYAGDSGDEIKTSKYNAAVAQLYRLDNLWKSAQYNSRVGLLMKWNWDLDSIWRELASDGTPKFEKEFSEINLLIIKYRKNRNRFYQLLMRKEIFLRKLQNEQGKGTAYYDESEDDFD